MIYENKNFIEKKFSFGIFLFNFFFAVVAPKVTLQQIEDEFTSKNQLTWKLKITDNGGGYAIRGRQLQLYCNISANPLVLATDIRWYKDSMLITDDDRIIVNNNNNKTNNSGDGKFEFYWKNFYMCIMVGKKRVE